MALLASLRKISLPSGDSERSVAKLRRHLERALQGADAAASAASAAAAVGCPTGMCAPFARSSAPSGWLLCDGSAVSRTTYAALFAALGTTWGAGDGSTTFNLPDLRGRSPIGSGTGAGGGNSGSGVPSGGSALSARARGDFGGEETHQLSVAEMPSHDHSGQTGDESAHTHGPGTYVVNAVQPATTTATGSANRLSSFGAGISGSVSGTSGAGSAHHHSIAAQGSGTAHNNLAPWVAMPWYVKT